MRFAIKSIVFYSLSAICALTILGIVNVAIFWMFTAAGLLELASSPLCIGGLAVTETCLAVYCISVLSEDVLYYIGEYDAPETTDEKET